MISAVILAGGSGKRFGTPIPKQFLTLGSKKVLEHSLEKFIHHPLIDEVVVVMDEENRSLILHSSKVKFAAPGKERQFSLQNALAISHPESQWIIVHDAARPFIDEALITRVIEAGKEHQAATCAMPIKFTVREKDHDSFATKSLNRDLLVEIQTPQMVKKEILLEGMKRGFIVTDDVGFAEKLGIKIKIVPGSGHNLKITTKEDLDYAHFLLQNTHRL